MFSKKISSIYFFWVYFHALFETHVRISYNILYDNFFYDLLKSAIKNEIKISTKSWFFLCLMIDVAQRVFNGLESCWKSVIVQHVWPEVKTEAMVHDSYLCKVVNLEVKFQTTLYLPSELAGVFGINY